MHGPFLVTKLMLNLFVVKIAKTENKKYPKKENKSLLWKLMILDIGQRYCKQLYIFSIYILMMDMIV